MQDTGMKAVQGTSQGVRVCAVCEGDEATCTGAAGLLLCGEIARTRPEEVLPVLLRPGIVLQAILAPLLLILFILK